MFALEYTVVCLDRLVAKPIFWGLFSKPLSEIFEWFDEDNK